MHYRLVSVSDLQSSELHLPAIVGRDSNSCVTIDHPSVSRAHCQFMLGPDESLQIRDMGSLNGTYVNGEKIKSIRTLLPGDNVQIGSSTFRVEFSSDTVIREPKVVRVERSTRGIRDTQPMSTVQSPSGSNSRFTIHEVVTPAKQWWEFWKVN